MKVFLEDLSLYTSTHILTFIIDIIVVLADLFKILLYVFLYDLPLCYLKCFKKFIDCVKIH